MGGYLGGVYGVLKQIKADNAYYINGENREYVRGYGDMLLSGEI